MISRVTCQKGHPVWYCKPRQLQMTSMIIDLGGKSTIPSFLKYCNTWLHYKYTILYPQTNVNITLHRSSFFLQQRPLSYSARSQLINLQHNPCTYGSENTRKNWKDYKRQRTRKLLWGCVILLAMAGKLSHWIFTWLPKKLLIKYNTSRYKSVHGDISKGCMPRWRVISNWQSLREWEFVFSRKESPDLIIQY